MLATLEAVKFAELNSFVQPALVPNDPRSAEQWHYRAMNLPQAWDITLGSSSVVVAVIDTGIAPHPDLDANVLPGVDLIIDPQISNDGDGRDDDPTDAMGPLSPQQRGSLWHGLHVAGTIAARTDNRLGVAGVAPNVRVVPIRVLGRGGGTSFDIAAGITWAIGATVPGIRRNANPAQVINMSLGGTGGNQTYAEVIGTALASNAVVVVAAGNDDSDTAQVTPCNVPGAICVGAVDYRGHATQYSNFGREVAISAPGGAVDRDDDADGRPDGVLSTVGNAQYALLQGTSMATPHISGLVALMKSQDRTLTAAQVRTRLQSSVAPIPNCPTSCGAGAIDAFRVLRSLSVRTARPGQLVVSAEVLVFTETNKSHVVRVSNVGDLPLDVSVLGQSDLIKNFHVNVDAFPFSIAGGASRDLTISYRATINIDVDIDAEFETDGAAVPISLKLRKPRVPPKTVVALARIGADDTFELVARAVAFADGSYSVSAPPGSYFVLAVVDDDGNGTFDDDEQFGLFPTREAPRVVQVNAGATVENVDFVTSR